MLPISHSQQSDKRTYISDRGCNPGFLIFENNYTVEVIKATFMLSLPVFFIVGLAENEVKADI